MGEEGNVNEQCFLLGSRPYIRVPPMTPLSLFGLFAVTGMLVSYAFEERSRWFTLSFAAACALGSAYGFLQGAWPFGLVEAVWSGVALRKWINRIAQ